jgi:hypothetical protein
MLAFCNARVSRHKTGHHGCVLALVIQDHLVKAMIVGRSSYFFNLFVSENRIRDLAGIITRDFRGIKDVNFTTLLLSSEAEAARKQVRALTFEKPISIGLSNHLQRPFTSPS